MNTTRANASWLIWHNELCRIAREHGRSASTVQGWMQRAYENGYTPSEAWELNA